MNRFAARTTEGHTLTDEDFSREIVTSSLPHKFATKRTDVLSSRVKEYNYRARITRHLICIGSEVEIRARESPSSFR